jgi:hypothetical protein
VIVYGLSNLVFPYRSINHDEGVYLTQAAMLLDGQIHLHPPVPEAFRPWFFVRDGGAFYPKYAPVPAAMFAAGKAAGDATLALAGIAASLVGLEIAVVRELFDRRTGLLAGCGLLVSPLFLIDAAVFLPYAATAVWLLAFALGYLRADRTGSWLAAAVAGLAIGVAVFARPYTAVLFGSPFVVHALWRCWRNRDSDGPRGATARAVGVTRAVGMPRVLVAAGGLLGVATTLAYNAHVTGDPLVFPYEAFAPRDGIGFGHRELLGHELEYTPEIALESNRTALELLVTRWFVAGPVGAALAGLGGAVCLYEWLSGRSTGRSRQLAFVGVLPAVVVGQLYFWGTYNALGPLADHLGPYYHFPVLLVGVALAARATIAIADWVRHRCHALLSAPGRLSGVWTERLAVTLLFVGALVLAATAGAAVVDPIRDNAAYTDRLETAYEPIEERSFDRALVFLPTPHGDWLNHPFQHLRNDPGYDGEVVYALEERPFAVVDAFPDRSVYRYRYRGIWAPGQGERVDPALRRVRVVEGESISALIRVGLPNGTQRVSIRLAGTDDVAYYTVDATTAHPESLPVNLTVTPGQARLDGPVAPAGNGAVGTDEPTDPARQGTVAVGDLEDVTLTLFADYGAGGGVTYRFRTPVAVEDDRVRVLMPERTACTRPRRCGEEGGASVPGTELPEGVSVNVRLVSNAGSTGQ